MLHTHIRKITKPNLRWRPSRVLCREIVRFPIATESEFHAQQTFRSGCLRPVLVKTVCRCRPQQREPFRPDSNLEMVGGPTEVNAGLPPLVETTRGLRNCGGWSLILTSSASAAIRVSLFASSDSQRRSLFISVLSSPQLPPRPALENEHGFQSVPLEPYGRRAQAGIVSR